MDTLARQHNKNIDFSLVSLRSNPTRDPMRRTGDAWPSALAGGAPVR